VRARVRRAIVGTVALALLLLGVPLAAALNSVYRGQAETRLEGEAARVLVSVPDDPVPELPAPRDATTTLGLYDATGRLVAGHGPRVDDAARRAGRTRSEVRAVNGDDIVVVVPFRRDSGGNGAIASVRAASPYSEVRDRTYRAWGLTALLGLGVLAIAWFVGSRRARALALPFERLTADAQALGRGDFGLRPHSTGLVEADAAEVALAETATRLGALLDRERAFSADASHQLRTPVTRLRLGLESALLDPGADREVALQDAVTRLDALEQTVTSLLALARDTSGPGGPCDVGSLVTAAQERWSAAASDLGRAMEVAAEGELPDAACSPAALAQVLDVLVDNALRHGAGTVRVTVRRAGPGVAVDVSDEGPGLGPDPETAFVRRSPAAQGHGIGLALARSLTAAEGGRLVVTSPGPRPVLSVLLPATEGAA
jgi:signal transduction histidine kinase